MAATNSTVLGILIGTVLSAVLAHNAAADEARATRFDSGVGLALGGFGIKGAFAREAHGEGGQFLKVPLFVRFRSYEFEAAPFLGWGAIDRNDSSWAFQGWSFSMKKFVSLSSVRDRQSSVYFDAYVRGGVDRTSYEHLDGHHLGASFGAGLALRMQAGRAVRVSYRFFVELSRTYYGGGDWALADSRTQSFAVGLTFLGIGG